MFPEDEPEKDEGIGWNDLSGVDPALLGKAVSKLEILDVGYSKLTQQQTEIILAVISQGSEMNILCIKQLSAVRRPD